MLIEIMEPGEVRVNIGKIWKYAKKKKEYISETTDHKEYHIKLRAPTQIHNQSLKQIS